MVYTVNVLLAFHKQQEQTRRFGKRNTRQHGSRCEKTDLSSSSSAFFFFHLHTKQEDKATLEQRNTNNKSRAHRTYWSFPRRRRCELSDLNKNNSNIMRGVINNAPKLPVLLPAVSNAEKTRVSGNPSMRRSITQREKSVRVFPCNFFGGWGATNLFVASQLSSISGPRFPFFR